MLLQLLLTLIVIIFIFADRPFKRSTGISSLKESKNINNKHLFIGNWEDDCTI